MDTSNLANRMKDYEKRNQYYLQKRTPVVIRVDGCHFHTFTKGFKRPFDDILIKSMQETAKYMCENIQGAKLAYVQSDEITIILVDYDTLETDCWFKYRTDKLCSVAASMATMKFNQAFAKNVKENQPVLYKNDAEKKLYESYQIAINHGAIFDARCFNIPKEEVTNCIYWRQLDATRNSIQMVGQANFSHKELEGKSCNKIQDMLLTQKDINWNNYPTVQKRGSACIRFITYDDNKYETDWKVDRPHWIIDTEMPILKDENRKYVDELIYIGD